MKTRTCSRKSAVVFPEHDDCAPREFLRLAGEASEFFKKAATADDVLVDEAFMRGVDFLTRQEAAIEWSLEYLSSTNKVIQGVAAASLSNYELDDQAKEKVFSFLPGLGIIASVLAVRALHQSYGRKAGLSGRVILEYATDSPSRLCWMALRSFFESRIDVGDDPCTGDWLGELDDQEREELAAQVMCIGGDLGRRIRKWIKTWTPSCADIGYLQKVGRVLKARNPQQWPPLVLHEALNRAVEQGNGVLESEHHNSVLYVGESGVGKKSTVKVLLESLVQDGWIVLELSATKLMVGQSGIGQVEERVERIATSLASTAKSVWHVSDITALTMAGRHSKSDVSVLDMIAPHLQSGRLKLVGEVDPAEAEYMKLSFGESVHLFQEIVISPLSTESSRLMVDEWNKRQAGCSSGIRIRQDLVDDACRYIDHYCRDIALPGVLIDVLSGAIQNTMSRRRAGALCARVAQDDLLMALEGKLGVPRHIIKPDRPLSSEAIQGILRRSVKGQEPITENISGCLARIFHGLSRNDLRPLGVFFFAGSTGTGKTELAKAIAELMMGDQEHMVRIDMSELNTQDSFSRLLGDSSGSSGQSLVSQIRQRPFSVILLDEFEKAHPSIHRVFLQAFDEGRLTDAMGRVVSFRNCLFVLTSNLGSGGSTCEVGFGRSSLATSRGLDEALKSSLSPELRNRLTEIVEFQPLSPEVLGLILDKHVESCGSIPRLSACGISISLASSARKFIVTRAARQNLGARPLLRMVDKYVLRAVMEFLDDSRGLSNGVELIVVRDGERDRLVCMSRIPSRCELGRAA
jgi:ATP-dependent Clp protease ATP-binding subunit ClpC